MRHITIAETPMVISIDSDSDGSSWDDVEILDGDTGSIEEEIPTVDKSSHTASSPPFHPNPRTCPDRPLHMSLCSRTAPRG